jgi:hypothetical protein
MLWNQIGSLVGTLALAIPFVQECDPGTGPTVEPDELLPAGEQPCCEASKEPACDDPEVVACVCDRDAYCCESRWDSTCASEADEFCDAQCA